MSHRRALLVAGIGIVTALALSWYTPQCFSPVPELVVDLKSCLEPREWEAACDTTPSDQSQEVIVEVRVIGFNCSRTGTTLLSDGDTECKLISGCVTDDERLWSVVERLRANGCISSISYAPQLRALNRETFVSARGYCSPFFMPGAKGVASVSQNGRIHLQLNASWSESKDRTSAAGGVFVRPEFNVVDARVSVELRSGQSCFIGGLKRKINLTEDYRLPLVSNFPRVGSWFEIRTESVIDEELLILVTARVGAPK